ncbi:MAG: hypothetical protein M1383_00130 [Patescibacteria group bacterium]|nr:hypothetical protein [Patescibacteria group bacterium]
MIPKRLKNFNYEYEKGSGPLQSPELLDSNFTKGNCRTALQLYFYYVHSLFLKPEQILLPEGYKNTGKFIFKEEPIDFGKLNRGAVIYAQNLRGKKEQLLNKDKDTFPTEDEWILHLHTAIYLGEFDSELSQILPEGEDYPKHTPLVWHATTIEGKTCVWTLEKFLHYYKSISAKRINDKFIQS